MSHVQACIIWHYDSHYTNFYIIFISVEGHFWVFLGTFWCIFLIFWEPFNIISWNFVQMFLVLLWRSLIFHVMSSSAGGYFVIFLDPLWCVIFYFLRTVQYFFMKFFKDFQKLYGPFLTVSRLQSHYEETVYLLPLSPQKVLVLILIGLVLLWQSLHKRKVFSLNRPFG